jgi:hypothetical protein
MLRALPAAFAIFDRLRSCAYDGQVSLYAFDLLEKPEVSGSEAPGQSIATWPGSTPPLKTARAIARAALEGWPLSFWLPRRGLSFGRTLRVTLHEPPDDFRAPPFPSVAPPSQRPVDSTALGG